MTDKLKDQTSGMPAATDDGKRITAKKPGGKTQVIINPPEKVQRDANESFKQALAKHTVVLEKKIELVLQGKAQRSELPEETLRQVFIRGFKSLPLNTELTREQYAMNRVNSFMAGGAAMKEDYDLIPVMERMGLKGTGGARRPHIKREKSPYNGRTVFHVVDAKGHIKHSTSDEGEAKQHLATKYNSYMEGTLSPMKRFEGTKSLVKTYKDDTPGEKLKEGKMSELDIDMEDMKDKDFETHYGKPKSAYAPKKKPEPTTKPKPANVKEETLSELKSSTLTSYIDKVSSGPSRGKTQTGLLKSIKAIGGVTKAIRKRAENDIKEDTLNEISKDLAHNYMVAAHKKYGQLDHKNDAASNAKKAKLEKGIKKAAEIRSPKPKQEPEPKHDSSPSGYYASKKPGEYTGD